jgi:stage III sporulation protein SpoIIIAA
LTQVTSPSDELSQNPTTESEEFQALLRIFPAWIQETLEPFESTLEEVVLDSEEPLHFRVNEAKKYHATERVVTNHDLTTVARHVGGFKDNGRTGIKGTLHRVSEKRDDYDMLVGLTIRKGKHVSGVAEVIAPYFARQGSMIVIGSPGKGKSTLLRDLVRIRGDINQKQTCVIDTSGEIGGHSRRAHWCIGNARRFHVTNASEQARILTRVIQNHSPVDIIVDEIGYNEDVLIVERAARSGTRVVATVHGETILDIMENPMLDPLLGYPNKLEKRRLARPTFRMALEVVDKGKYLLFDDLGKAVDVMLLGGTPEGIRLGEWSKESASS